MTFGMRILIVFVILAGIGIAFTFERPSVEAVQLGYRGVGIQQVENLRVRAASLAAANQRNIHDVPEIVDPALAEGQDDLVSAQPEVYKNVQVLGHLTSGQFNRLMVAITNWVSPDEGDYFGGTPDTRNAKGCAYCHKEGEELSSDSLYTKVVARRMLQMTQHLNANWKPHVADTGVTCHTCHRGKPIPANIWFVDPGARQSQGALGSRAGQNEPAPKSAYASLPADPFTPFLAGEPDNIRVIGTTALAGENRRSIKQTEWTYGLMMHMSQGLGVNCTYCHNSRLFQGWSQSSPARLSAWHGIRMVRDLNVAYLDPLRDTYPATRLGTLQDAPKANCATCHWGVYKPYYGQSVLKDYVKELAPPGQQGAEATPYPAQPRPQ